MGHSFTRWRYLFTACVIVLLQKLTRVLTFDHTHRVHIFYDAEPLLLGEILDGWGSCPFAKAVGHFRVELEFWANEHSDAVQDEHGARVRARNDQHGRPEA